jgi:hypothetical protein
MSYDKSEVKKALTIENLFDLVQEWGGDPEYTSYGFLSATICHNKPGEGSRKLYYYSNSTLFQCYTGCQGSFDIFELLIKVARIQWGREFDLNDAVRYIAIKFGIITASGPIGKDELEDWKYLTTYDRVQSVEVKDYHIQLKEYDAAVLDRLNYNVRLDPWLREGMTQEVLDFNRIGWFPGNDQITIPHFDKDGRFVGLRGRTMCKEEAERFGKYRPIIIGKQLYNHPLGMNLYNLNHSLQQIQKCGIAIVFESEKSCLLYQSYFGTDNDITVACCGSNISAFHVQLLLDAGAKEMVVAFDRQFQQFKDDEYKHLTDSLTKIYNKYKNDIDITFIFDREMITGYKDSPIDCGADKFLTLWKRRVHL